MPTPSSTVCASAASGTARAGIAAVPAHMIGAWAAHDAAAFAELFTQDALFSLRRKLGSRQGVADSSGAPGLR